MAVTTLTAQTSTRGGVDLTFVAPDAVDGIEFNNASKKAILVVKNDSVSSVNLTIDITATLDGMTVADRVIAIGAGEVTVIGPFNDIYNQTDNFVRGDFSAVTDVTVALLVPGSLANA